MKIIRKKLDTEAFGRLETASQAQEIIPAEEEIRLGDCLTFEEWDGETFTGRTFLRPIAYILRTALQPGGDKICIVGWQI